ncbi:MAG: shikimate kinase [Thermoguttaceae bacterium]|nr:shikimate kinase [Thermoguttaceae bacterium]
MREDVQKTKIILIGYRATGKSTVAAALAERWGFDWVDLDVWIEETAQSSIADIFARRGETYFRDLEERALVDVLALPQPLVVATGGGTPLRESSRRLMKEHGVVVWLTASVDTIARRMLGDQTTQARRPSLTGGKSPVDEIARVLAVREPIYREVASTTIDTEGRTVDEIVLEIADSVPDFFV